MKKHYHILSVVLLVLCAAGLVTLNAQEKYDALIGTWDVETESGTYTFVFEFFMDKGTLAGKFTGSSGEVEMEDLTYENGDLTFSVNVDAGGSGMTIDFSATIDGSSLTGMLSLEYGESEISGTKRKT